MENSQSRSLINRFIIFSKLASLIVILIGVLVIIGWVFNIQPLKSIFPGFQTMKVNTALAFILTGLILWIPVEKRQQKYIYFYIKQISGIVTLLIGFLTLS